MGWSTERDRRCRARGDEGAALVEFSLVMVLLFTLLFGIIHFGLILSFKQDVTRAAAEGARAGATMFPANVPADVEAEAEKAADEAAKAFGGSTWAAQGCARQGMSCVATEGLCAGSATQRCITVTVTYDYDLNPLYGEIPVIGGLVAPDTVTATAVARTNA